MSYAMCLRLATRWLSGVLIAFAAVGARAGTVNMVTSNGTSDNWNTAVDWSNNAVPSAANDYVVGSSFVVRTPLNAATATFVGNSLTVMGTMSFKGNSTGTATVNLTLDGGTLTNGNASNAGNLLGSITFANAVTLDTTTDGSRSLTFQSVLHGSGTVTAIGRGTVFLQGTGNDFSGTWGVGGTGSISTAPAKLSAQSAGSLGAGSVNVTVNANGRFDTDYDWTTTGALTLATGGVMVLDQADTVGALTIGGTSLADGTYSFSYLNTNYNAFFVDGGTGSITVATPEPASLSAVAVAGLIALNRRPRRNRNRGRE